MKNGVAKKQNFQAGDTVLLQNEPVRNKWSMAKNLKFYPNKNGFQQSVGLVLGKSSSKEQKMAVDKLFLLG